MMMSFSFLKKIILLLLLCTLIESLVILYLNINHNSNYGSGTSALQSFNSFSNNPDITYLTDLAKKENVITSLEVKDATIRIEIDTFFLELIGKNENTAKIYPFPEGSSYYLKLERATPGNFFGFFFTTQEFNKIKIFMVSNNEKKMADFNALKKGDWIHLEQIIDTKTSLLISGEIIKYENAHQ